MQACTTESSKTNVSIDIPAYRARFIYRFTLHEKDKKKLHKKCHVTENLFLLFEVITSEHVGTQGTLACEHASNYGT